MTLKKSIYPIILGLALVLSACGNSEVSYYVPDAQDVMMYQVNPRVFAPEDSFAAVEKRLDDIRELGTNVVWFMPIYPVGQVNTKNSPYCIRDYKAVNPEFGTIESFGKMISACHERGMAVIVDWVANHTAWDNPWTENKDWYTQDKDGNIIFPEGTDWTDVADLNFDNAEMRLAMIDAMKWWVTEVGVDGFRCDAADYVPYDFWEQAIDSLRAIPDHKLLLLAEGIRDDHFKAGFEMDYAWGFMGALREVFIRGAAASTLFDVDEMEYKDVPEGCVKLRFTTNHDEATKLAPIVEYGGRNGSMSAFAIASLLHGGALLYGSQEVGHPDPINFFRYEAVDWDANPDIRAEYAKLISLYNEFPALRKGGITPYPDENVLLFEKHDSGDRLLIAVNVRNEPFAVALPEDWQNAEVEDQMNGQALSLGTEIPLKAYEYKILRRNSHQ
ncbi:MAG: alpha-amylase [Bacteroidales bacterium]|nr:alpha-amylase [Bacteroidales bacterium]